MIALKPAVLDLEHAAHFVALSISTVEQLVRDGSFPKPRQLSGRRTGYLVRELEDWVNTRPVSSLPPPPNTGAPKPGRRKAQDAQPAA